MSFGISGGGPTQNPSESFGENFSSSFGFGGSQSQSSSYSQQNPDIVWPAQAQALQALWGLGFNQLGQGTPGGVNEVYQGAVGGLGQLFNPGVNPALGAYQNDVQRNLTENLLPALDRGAAGFGQFGGTRGDVGRGLAVTNANRDISDMAARLYSDDMNRMLGAVQQAPAIANLGLGIPWYGLNQMSGLLGSPVVLGQGGYSTSQASGSSSQQSGSSGYGYDYGFGGGTDNGLGFNIGI